MFCLRVKKLEGQEWSTIIKIVWIYRIAVPTVKHLTFLFCVQLNSIHISHNSPSWCHNYFYCSIAYSEVSNNSSDLLIIFGNFFQQNRLIMVWIIINFYIVLLQNDYFKQNFGFLVKFQLFELEKVKKFQKIFQQNSYCDMNCY